MSDQTQKRVELVHPRITRAYAKSLIEFERLISDPEMLITVYMVRLKNGHRIVTDAIVANKELFDSKRGESVAKKKAIDQIIKDELYLLRDKLHMASTKGIET